MADLSRDDALDRYLELRPVIRARMAASVPDELRMEFGEVTPHQIRALLVLGEHGRTMSSLATAMGSTPATTSVLGDRLVGQGLVSRAPDPDDRRRVRLVPTERGRSLAVRVNEAQRSAAEVLFARLTDRQIAAWLEVLETLAAADISAGEALLEGAR